MRLIDADAFKEELKENYTFYGFSCLLNDFYVAIDEAPTIKRKRGEWIAKTENYHSHWVCSECGAWALLEYNEQMCLSNFCPNCGADMRGADDEDSA